MARQFKVPVNLVSLTADPVSANPGDIYFNSSTSFIRLYTTASGWQNVGGSGGGGGGGGTINHTHNYDGSVIVGSGGSLVTTATFGSGVPNNVLGLDGDVYIDTTNLNIYTKSAGAWGSPTEINVYTKEEITTLLSGKSDTGHTHTLASITDVTASAAELNLLDGATITTTELNYLDGVTSSIQTQLDNVGNSLGDYIPLNQINQPDGVPGTDPNGNILVPTVPSALGAGLKFRDNTIQTTAITPAMLEDIEVLALAAL